MADIEEEITADVSEFVSAMDEAAAAAEELDNRVSAARDAIAEMDAAGGDAEAAAAALEQAAGAAESAARAMASARDSAAEAGAASAGLADASEAAAGAMDQAAVSAEAEGTALGHVRDEALEAAAAYETLAEGVKASNDGNYFAVGSEQAVTALQAEETAMQSAGSAADGLAARTVTLSGAAKDYAAAADRSIAAMGAQRDAASNLEEIEQSLGTPAGRDLLQGNIAAGKAMGDYEASIAKVNAALEEATPLIEANEGILDNAGNAASNLGDDMAYSAESIATAKFAMAGFAETAAEDAAGFDGLVLAESEMDAANAAAMASNELAAASFGHLRDEALEAAAGVTAAAAAVDAADIEEEASTAGAGIADAITGALSSAGGALGSAGSGIGGAFGKLGSLAMPALITGIGGLIGGLTPAILSVGSGFVAFAALAAPALDKVKNGLTAVDTAQSAYNLARATENRDPTAANLTAQQKALDALRSAWAVMPAPVAEAVRQIKSFGHAWSEASKHSGIQQDALHDIAGAARFGKALLPSFVTLAQSAAKIFDGTFSNLIADVKGPKYKNFIASMTKQMAPEANGLQQVFGSIGGFFAQLTEKGAKTGPQFLTSIARMLKTTTPAAVSGFLDLAKGLEHTANAITDVTKAVSHSPLDKWVRGTVGLADLALRNAGHYGGELFGIGGKKPVTVHQPVKVVPQFSSTKSVSDFTKSLSQGTGGTAVAKLPVAVKADTSKLAGQINDAAKQVQVHGLTVSLANAKLSGMAALSGTMSTAGKAAGKALDTGLASAIQSGAGTDTAAARAIAASIKGALSGLPGQLRSVGTAAADGLAAGIRAGTASAVSAAQQMASAVEQAARTHLQTQSPSKVFRKIGTDTVAGFVLGLEGGKKQVRAALQAMLGHPVNDLHIAEVIAKMRREVEAAFDAGTISRAQDSEFTALLRADNDRLQGLAAERARIEARIKAADALARTVRTAAMQAGSVVSAFGMTYTGQAPAMAHYKTIQGAMKAQLDQTRAFRRDIEKLKKEGLDKASIRQILREGVTGGLPIAEQLLAGGKGGIKETSHLEEELRKAAKRLGIVGANAGYESGKHMGQGLAAGLKSELGAITREMHRIAEELVKAIRKALKIASPSQVMADIGAEVPRGLAMGMDGHRSTVSAAAQRMAMSAVAHPAMSRAGGYGASYGGGRTELPHLYADISVTIDGKRLGRTVQSVQLQHAGRNIRTGNQLRGRGT